MTDNKNEEKIKELYIHSEIMKQQLTALVEEKNAIEERINEIMMTTSALESMKNVSSGSETWSALGNGTFIRTEIMDTEKVLIGIGAGIVVKEKRERALEILNERTSMMVDANNAIVAEANKIANELRNVEIKIQELAGQKV